MPCLSCWGVSIIDYAHYFGPSRVLIIALFDRVMAPGRLLGGRGEAARGSVASGEQVDGHLT